MGTSTDQRAKWKVILAPVITGIVPSALTLIIGFYLGHALARPKFSIEGANQTFYVKPRNVSDGVLKEVASQPLLESTLRDALIRRHLESGEIQCTEWLEGEDWDERCKESVLVAANGIYKTLESAQLSPNQKASFGKTLLQLIAEVQAEPRATGDVDLDIAVLNGGDFDGVVSPAGEVTFKDGSFSIYADEYTVVKAHGFARIHFSQLVDDAAKAWRSRVKGGEKLEIQIVLYGNGKPIRSKQMMLDRGYLRASN